MTKSELMKIITEIVKKEVQKEVNRIFIKESKPTVSKPKLKPKKVEKPIKHIEQNFSKDPVLNKIRRFIPNLGSIDISPVILILLLIFIRNLFFELLAPNLF